jgi:hypothetical protein
MKKHLLALLLSCSALHISHVVHAQNGVIIDLTDNEDEVEHNTQEVLPILATCEIDSYGDIIQITGVQHLGKKDILALYKAIHEEKKKDSKLTALSALQQILSGSIDIASGTFSLIYVGGRWITPKALELSGQTWNFLKTKFYDTVEYLSEEDEIPLY